MRALPRLPPRSPARWAAYVLSHAAPVVAVAWGMLVWARDTRRWSPSSNAHGAMVVLMLAGLSMVALAPGRGA
ncbi:MAG: hypothetical protein WDO18_15625 [Acidobacteriota bacterium]